MMAVESVRLLIVGAIGLTLAACGSGPLEGGANDVGADGTVEPPAECGDGICEGRESPLTCPADCVQPNLCGDNQCGPDESTASCAQDCGSFCGDGVCNGTESTETCTQDCGGNRGPPGFCGDGECGPDETNCTCASDCDGVCAEDPPTAFSDYDDFDENNIVWLHTDVSGWDVTSTVTGTHIDYDKLCVYHTKAGKWPEVFGIFPEAPEDPMEGNIWIIARVDGVWYAATFDYLRPGDECKYDGYAPDDEGPGPSTFGAAPLSTWAPQSGEPVYMFMSTVARHGPLGPLNERSDYAPLIWP